VDLAPTANGPHPPLQALRCVCVMNRAMHCGFSKFTVDITVLLY
jgi:hypothetical protein